MQLIVSAVWKDVCRCLTAYNVLISIQQVHLVVIDMSKKIVYSGGIAHDRRIALKEMPEDRKCDFRRDYESGKTLKDIAEKYCCDPRTVRKCILINKSSDELGQQTAPTKLTEYMEIVDLMYHDLISPSCHQTKSHGICMISREIFGIIKEQGYSGSERTVRNYIRMKYQFVDDDGEE